MKNLLKLSFAICLMVSCSNEDAAEINKIDSINLDGTLNSELVTSFDEETEITNFFFNGKTITEEELNNLDLENTTSHYDFPNGKLELFSTQEKFQEYLDSNSKLKMELEANAKAAVINDKEQVLIMAQSKEGKLDTESRHPNQDFDGSYVDADVQDLSNSLAFIHYDASSKSIWDTFSISNTANQTYVRGVTSNNFEIRGRRVRVGNMGKTATGERMYLRNLRDTPVTKTFYQLDNYIPLGGTVSIVTVQGHSTVRISSDFGSIR